MVADDTSVQSALKANLTAGLLISASSGVAKATSVKASNAMQMRMAAFVTRLPRETLPTDMTTKNTASTLKVTSMAPSVKMPSSVLV